MNLEKFRTALEKIDKPPDFKAIVLREDPPNYLESMMNEQINPEFNKNWAKDLHEKSVSPEVDEAMVFETDLEFLSIGTDLTYLKLS